MTFEKLKVKKKKEITVANRFSANAKIGKNFLTNKHLVK
jgi:hypothetical protein